MQPQVSVFARAVHRCILAALTVVLVASAVAPTASGEPAPEDEIIIYLNEINRLTSEALSAAEAAARAESIEDVKMGAERVFRTFWGMQSGLARPGSYGAVAVHGWKERWQTDETDFDSVYAIRYSGLPPTITDPHSLGIIGRGRAARELLEALVADSTAPEAKRMHAGHALASLNNVIGWTKMDTGLIKNEIQPRVDLTRLWDAPVDFWNSSADTGWAFEALSQAINILKVDYKDVREARSHAMDMARLIRAYVDGADANGDGRIAPAMMEGGLATAIEHAGLMKG